MTPDIPAEYTAILMGAVALYGGLTFIIVQLLRRFFPIENNVARVTAVIVAVGLGAWAAAQHLMPLWSTIAPDQRVTAVLGVIGAIWWTSQEIYRRLRADTWKTKAAPWPNE